MSHPRITHTIDWPPRDVIIYGHSFVSRLKSALDDLDNDSLLTDFGLTQAVGRIEYISRPGGHISDVRRDVMYFYSIQPKVVFLQIAGNDLRGDRDNSREVVDLLMETVSLLAHMSFVKAIFICQLLYRFPGKYYTLPQSYQYQQNVDKANYLIQQRVGSIPYAEVIWWKLEGIKNNTGGSVIRRDGVHLDELAMVLYYKAIRRALIVGYKKSRPCKQN